MVEPGGEVVPVSMKWEVPSEEPEIICGIDSSCIIFPQENNADSNHAMHQYQGGVQYQFHDQDVFGIQVTEEEVVSEVWDNGQIVADVGSEEIVGEMKVAYTLGIHPEEEIEIPLPQDQDTYTTMRPYPCDFCSRRFRKKANLMNHMVAHQTDRPHGCNLCGARYRRKCDLINHMKIHAYAPGLNALSEEEEEEPVTSMTRNNVTMKGRRKKAQSSAPRKRKNAASGSKDYDNNEEPSTKYGKRKVTNSTSRKKYTNSNAINPAHNYVDEDMKLLMQSPSNFVGLEVSNEVQEPAAPPRWPVLDESRPYVCQHCGVGFAREKALASHARIHAGDSPFECNTCGEMFWDLSFLKEHAKNKHGGALKYEDDMPYTGDDRFGEFNCETCGIGFHRQDLLKRHRRLHVKGEPGDLTCQVCGQSFADEADLQAHSDSHTRFQPHRCMLCGECFTDGSAVAVHVRRRHAKNIPPNTCTLCGKTCKDRRSLQKHSWVHSSDKSFTCHECSKRFHSRARLKRHMLSHRDKAVTCEECGEDFADGRALINHRHSHNKDLTARQFSCLECGKTFGSRSSQQIHARIHTGERPYGCRFCWKAFADGGTLRKHERIHTGEKPYACVICPRAFNQRVVLREHIRSHHSGPDKSGLHGHAVFSCKVCETTFTRSDELCAHLIRHSDENTAKHRLPRIGPRKYKRRRKLNPHELHRLSAASDPMDSVDRSLSDSDSGDHIKRKIVKKKYKSRNQNNANENLESVVKTFESVVENFNSIVGHTKSEPGKKKNEKKRGKSKGKLRPGGKYTNNHGINNSKPGTENSTPNYSSGGFVKRPVGEGRVRPRTKNVTSSTLAALKAVSSKPGSHHNAKSNSDMNRIRPRTKNVNYHNVKMAKLAPVTFSEMPPADIEKFTVDKSQEKKLSKSKIDLKKQSKSESSKKKASSGKGATKHSSEGDQNIKVEFTCEMCSATFVRKSDLLIHVPIHI